MGLTKVLIASLCLSAGAGAGLSFRDPHPIVAVEEKPAFVAPAPIEAALPAAAIAGLDYDSNGQIVAARIEGLEPPAAAQNVQPDAPVS